tara:strand:- start:34 stop:183 length:150 start_codon:yes stop_codon:yes gene_type:complete
MDKKIKSDLDRRLKEYFDTSNEKTPDHIVKKIRKIAEDQKVLREKKDDN